VVFPVLAELRENNKYLNILNGLKQINQEIYANLVTFFCFNFIFNKMQVYIIRESKEGNQAKI